MIYTKIFLEDNRLKVKMLDGSVKDCGKNLVGMVLYCYFDSIYDNVPDDWEVDGKKFRNDYQSKIFEDVKNGNIKPV